MTDDHGPDTGAADAGAIEEDGLAVDESAGSGVSQTELTSIERVTKGNHWASGRLLALLGLLALVVIGVAFCTASLRGDADDVVNAVAAEMGATGAYDGVGVDGAGGTITLTGTVETEASRDEAGELALATSGVRRVINDLEVVPVREATPITTVVSPPTTEEPVTPTSVAQPATTAPSARAEVDLNSLDPITFNTNSAEITAEGRIVLDRAVAILADNPELIFEVAGHTDSDGDEEANLDLSQRRAAAVVAYVAAQDAGPDRLIPRGYGEDRPIADNDTPEGKAENRRIEWTFQDS